MSSESDVQTAREKYDHDAIWCIDCEEVVAVTIEWSQSGSDTRHLECDCTNIQVDDNSPKNWTTVKPDI